MGRGKKTAGASGIIQMDTSDGEGRGELLDRTLPLSTLPCRAAETELSREGGTWGGREGERGWDRLIRHDRIRLGASSIIRTKLAHRNTQLDGSIEEGEEEREGRGGKDPRHVHSH